ncbi:P2 family phage major capsid protein [Providencia rettgeri]|uniref:P2 family phage major capsid protein n=1 Tax=Providencia TaxID=586 RepID=UPI00234B6A12|nr:MULTISPECIES: P2 family phage major capsid protein [unclassified Providencia]ELH9583207.1 P2 family phage major capsid protein [Providencia rettgeri]ELM3938352.1 P2 family phage major capsid protein [Providencia rettgeri]EMA4646448.1 P2 family phage major capsid protein [Providencia rettgeri]WRR98623.1 P2 family phage major capsid protein [Providencia rettgeri]
MYVTTIPDVAMTFHANFTRGANYLSENSQMFSISEPSENLLRVAISDASWFMNQLTLADVSEERGNTINLGDNTLHTGRTIATRFHKNINFEGMPYVLEETDTCAAISFEQMSMIANSGSGDDEHFTKVMSDLFSKAVSLDMIRVGFNGEFCGYPTKPDVYKRGQDVNKGWHAIAAEFNEGSQIVTDKIVLGKDGAFPNLDAMANYLIMKKIPEEYREDPRLVVLVGAELAGLYREKLFAASDKPADIQASQMALSTVAGRFAIIPPFMPGRRLVVTTLDNLHIYTQKHTRRFRAEFVDDRKVYEHSYLRNEGYGLGDGRLYAAIDENAIQIEEGVFSL